MEKNKGANLIRVFEHYNLLPSQFSSIEKANCPFHEDANPSMIVNFEEGNYYCFGCGESGESFEFVKGIESKYNGTTSELKALQIHTQILNNDISNNLKNIIQHVSTKKATQPEDYEELYLQAHDYYFGLKKIDWLNPQNEEEEKAKDYLINRGFTAEVLNKIKATITYNDSYPIIFPMFDNEEFKGWVCRTTDPIIEKKRKYLYNTGFSRATTLAGNYGSKRYVFITEGYMDMLKFRQYGIDNVVAILGWKISNDQIQKLKDRGVEYVISALDNDKAGHKGSAYLKQHFKVKKLKYLKGIEDPGDMTKDQLFRSINKTIERKTK